MCTRKDDPNYRRCVRHHPGTRSVIVVVRKSHPELSEEQINDMVRRLNREATAAGLRGKPVTIDQAEAMIDKMRLDLKHWPPMDTTYRKRCEERIDKLEREYEEDPATIDQAKMHIWSNLYRMADNEVGRKKRENPKRIAVDVDGILYDCHGAMNTYMAAKGYTKPESHMETYSLADYWNVPKETIMEEFGNAVDIAGMFRYGEPLLDGVAAIRKLYESGHTIVLITARDLPGREKKCREATIKWLREQGIPFDELHLTGEKEKIDFDVLLDDAPDNVDRVVGHGKEAVIVDRPWNRKEGHGHARRSLVDSVAELCRPEEEDGDTLFPPDPIEFSPAARERVKELGQGSTAGKATVA